ncbi:MAG: hypothetical protein L6R39_003010 [Caloplaca ligustica]|nr:MAG: hypothetical protein L6R39_003010 [Caloplaca ligustica]
MRDIYKNAKACVAWLGDAKSIESEAARINPEKNSSQEGIKYVNEQLSQALAQFHGLPPCKNPEEKLLGVPGAITIIKLLAAGVHLYEMPFWDLTSNGEVKLKKSWNETITVLAVIFDRPWWKRIWVVQEVILPPSTTLFIGHHELGLKECYSAALQLVKHDATCCLHIGYIWYGGFNNRVSRSLNNVPRLMRIYNLYRSTPVHLIHFLFALAIKQMASDPHDYVYGTLGLLEQPPENLRSVDYGSSVSHLYSEATLALYQESFNTLGYARGLYDSSASCLPTWACDWSSPRRYPLLSTLFQACGNTEYRDTSLNTEGLLQLQVIEIGTIARIGSVLDTKKPSEFQRTLSQWQDLAEDIIIQKAGGSNDTKTFDETVLPFYNSIDYNAGLTFELLRVLFREILCDEHGFPTRRVSKEHINDLFRWWTWVISDKMATLDELDLLRISEVFDIDWDAKTFFVSNTDLVGMGPYCLEYGDRVVIVQSSTVPLMLRSARRTSYDVSRESLTEVYQLVGTCFVDGIMDGEAVLEDSEWKAVSIM